MAVLTGAFIESNPLNSFDLRTLIAGASNSLDEINGKLDAANVAGTIPYTRVRPGASSRLYQGSGCYNQLLTEVNAVQVISSDYEMVVPGMSVRFKAPYAGVAYVSARVYAFASITDAANHQVFFRLDGSDFTVRELPYGLGVGDTVPHAKYSKRTARQINLTKRTEIDAGWNEFSLRVLMYQFDPTQPYTLHILRGAIDCIVLS